MSVGPASGDLGDDAAELALQRQVTRIALAAVSGAGFVLAGSGAIREHGLITRRTEDVDLFTSNQNGTQFAAAVDRVMAELQSSDFGVVSVRRTSQFARLQVQTTNGMRLEVDLGVDWRERDPVTLEVGPVLSLVDAVASKLLAVYGRGEPRDYLDLDAIRASGRFGDCELIKMAGDRDPGFLVDVFAEQLDMAGQIEPVDVERYGVTVEELTGTKSRYRRWAAELRDRPHGADE